MFTIWVIGKEDIVLPLCGAVRPNGGVLRCSGGSSCSLSDAKGLARYTVIGTGSLRHADIDGGIVIFRCPRRGSFSGVSISETATCVASEDDKRSLEYLRRRNNPALICGMSSKSTVTLSSFTDEDAVVTLQREIRNIHGLEAVPRDIKVTLTGKADRSAVMMISSVLFLTCGPENGVSHITV